MAAARAHPIHYALWISHGVLILAVILTLLTAEFGVILRIILAIALATPLLLAVPGLAERRRATYQWLMLLLVIYIGMAVLEVVATLGASMFSSVALLAALVELASLVRLIRLADPLPMPHE